MYTFTAKMLDTYIEYCVCSIFRFCLYVVTRSCMIMCKIFDLINSLVNFFYAHTNISHNDRNNHDLNVPAYKGNPGFSRHKINSEHSRDLDKSDPLLYWHCKIRGANSP